MLVINLIRGFCMALADSVPGVSGGTIAFLLGFYDQFIQSLDDLIRGGREKKINAVRFLIKIMIGWVIGFCAAVLVLTRVFESHIYAISSLFIGFIIFAIPYVAMEEKETIKRAKIWHLIFVIIGIAIVSAITYFNPVSGNGVSVDVDHLSFGLGIYVFFAAMIAISAMILPGISGSTLLLIFGLYVPVLGAVKEVLHLNFKYVPVLMIFGLGILTGIVLIIRLIRIALEKFRPQMIYLIIGLMIGSLYAIVMGPTTLDEPKAPMGIGTFSILFFIIGGAVIIGLQMLKKVMDKK
ncbi:MAG: DUF368 domain-containing protein [Clostridiales bacterium]|nr:DUF368 domain-containing protein [Clostridiales bacterium]MDY3746757.1 DUF368 domain-containing protein [Lachnospiraceae bacterium]